MPVLTWLRREFGSQNIDYIRVYLIPAGTSPEIKTIYCLL